MNQINKPFQQAMRTFSTAIFKKGVVIAWITLVVSLTLTAYSWYYTKNSIETSAKVHFEYIANEIEHSIIERMNDYEQVLRGGLGLFYASNEVTRKDWKNYVSSLRVIEKYPGIMGLGFAKIINKEDKVEHIKTVQAEGFPDYRIWPEYERNFYTSIIYIEPFSKRNQRSFGYDMFSEPVRRTAMEEARDRGEAVVSGKVTLVQEIDEAILPGTLMYMPLYSKDMNVSSLKERRNAIEGYVYSPFRIKDLVEGIIGERLVNIKLEIYDGRKILSENLMYSSTKADTSKLLERPLYEELINVKINGRDWTLRFVSLPEFEAAIDREKPLIVLVLGIVLSSLLFIVSRNLGNIFIINKKLEQLLESTVEGIYGIDRRGRCTFINNAAAKMFGYNAEECLGKDMHLLVHYKRENGDIYPFYECPNIQTMEFQKPTIIDSDVFWKKDGSFFPVEYSSYPLIDNGEATGAVIAFTDITERKKYLAQIESSLKEKEVLLREIHHRVKNNLQIISSILNLQTSYITDNRSLAIFEESRNRVKSMALIHEKLYENESLSRLSLKDYVVELIDNLLRSYRTNNRVYSEIKISAMQLNADTAIPLGLIINELVSNSLKYAFPNERRGKIHINIFPLKQGRFKMSVSDDGIGLPPDFDITKTNTLGLQLVSSLVTQLDGEIKVINNVGACFEINFKGLNLTHNENGN